MIEALACLIALAQSPIAQGASKVDFDLDGKKLETYCYKPATFKGERMIVVLHGVRRNADEYRDHSKAMAERFGALVVAPRFDAERFPSRLYQRGGILKEDGTAAQPSEWTYALVPKLAAAVRSREGKPQLKFWLIGHSAGGQFAARLAAFFECGAERIVAANPSSWTFPTRSLTFGYGFGGLPETLSSDDVIRGFLARPLTVYLGTADSVPDRDTDMSDGALIQGSARLQRGLAFFRFAKTVAERKNWRFAWTLVEANGVGHDHEKMFDHPACEVALFGTGAAG